MPLEGEDKILDAARAGDADAIQALVHHYQPDLKKFAKGVCQTTEDAEDAVQHTLYIISSKMGMFRKAAKVSSWLFTIVKNECLKFLRLRRNQVQVDDSIADFGPGIEDTLTHEQLLERVKLAFSQLEPIYREVFILRDVEGLGSHEVSQRLGITVASVKSRLHRARHEVRTNIQRLES